MNGASEKCRIVRNFNQLENFLNKRVGVGPAGLSCHICIFAKTASWDTRYMDVFSPELDWKEQIRRDLMLTLQWNRPDFAREEIMNRSVKVKVSTRLGLRGHMREMEM